MDYPELIAELTDRTGDSSVATRASMYLTMAESAINKDMRVAESESVEYLVTDSDGKATLPSDFSMVRMVKLGARKADLVDFPVVTIAPFSTLPVALSYAVQGNQILTNTPGTEITLYYYAKLQRLDITGTNWLIESDPAIYIYAMLVQIFEAKMEAEKAMAAQAKLDRLIEERRRADSIIRFGSKPYRAVGVQ